jgi:hypothetical protein
VPSFEVATAFFLKDGGTMTVKRSVDPLAGHPTLVQRRHDMFTTNNPSYEFIYDKLLREDYYFLQKALCYFRRVTQLLKVYTN